MDIRAVRSPEGALELLGLLGYDRGSRYRASSSRNDRALLPVALGRVVRLHAEVRIGWPPPPACLAPAHEADYAAPERGWAKQAPAWAPLGKARVFCSGTTKEDPMPEAAEPYTGPPTPRGVRITDPRRVMVECRACGFEWSPDLRPGGRLPRDLRCPYCCRNADVRG
jgi:hypothetical protein